MLRILRQFFKLSTTLDALEPSQSFQAQLKVRDLIPAFDAVLIAIVSLGAV